ncbi:hypothetical protein SAMN05443633_101552 [Chryseobacterium arachidis]|uniref:Uncharacterized protein n=1 Tax=Chryseobacterium arachidis TaxID=1416778 RepID=A0A1M4UMK5_9FLAO|nr:hypothetical protein [Chryseobacterium arachidis]SHE57991.1 hypothetical protein SAMN05443633_101552 [Chryseobacterium arachidis]
MKKLFYSFLLLSSVTLFAQKNTATRFAVANDIVGTVDMFTSNHKGSIQSTQTYKTAASLPQNLKKFNYIADNGLVEYKLKKGHDNIDRVAVFEVLAQFGLPEGSSVLIDGYEFTDPKTLLFGDILNHMKTIDYNGKKAVSITTKQ